MPLAYRSGRPGTSHHRTYCNPCTMFYCFWAALTLLARSRPLHGQGRAAQDIGTLVEVCAVAFTSHLPSGTSFRITPGRTHASYLDDLKRHCLPTSPTQTHSPKGTIILTSMRMGFDLLTSPVHLEDHEHGACSTANSGCRFARQTCTAERLYGILAVVGVGEGPLYPPCFRVTDLHGLHVCQKHVLLDLSAHRSS